MDYDDLLSREVRASWDEIWREQIALLCLGPKGEHFDGDEWETRADALHRDPAAYLSS